MANVGLQTGAGLVLEVAPGIGLAVRMASGLPPPWTAQCSLLDFGADLTSPTGGPTQRIGRLGSRWRAKITAMPAIDADCARALTSARTYARANALPMTIEWPQVAFDASAIGEPAVSAGGQRGTSLSVSGLTPAADELVAGLFFSMTVAEKVYLYCLTADAVVAGDGTATLAIAPMLRASPAAGAPLEFGSPQISGFVDGPSEDFTLSRLSWTGLAPFSITERA